MPSASHIGSVGIALAVTVASAALAWHDCLLLLTAAVLSYQVLLFRLDAAASVRPLRSAIDVWLAGVAVVAAAALMSGCLAFAALGWWSPTVGSLALAALATAAAAGWSLWSSSVTGGCGWRVWPCLALGGALATWAMPRGLPIAPCLMMLVIGSMLAWRGWQMVIDTASSLHEGR